jgi:hypothetical protein
VRCHAVRANAKNNGVLLLQHVVVVAEAAGLGGAPGVSSLG